MKRPEFAVGTNLPDLRKIIKQENINLYAEASRDFNPIHINEEFARKTPAGGTIAHGMLVLAYVSEMMAAAFGRSWMDRGKLDVRFKSAARPGDTITVTGTVARVERKDGYASVRCEVSCQNQKRETVITGEASAEVPE